MSLGSGRGEFGPDDQGAGPTAQEPRITDSHLYSGMSCLKRLVHFDEHPTGKLSAPDKHIGPLSVKGLH